jgi:DNA-binding transcriptional ArsR family regulator
VQATLRAVSTAHRRAILRLVWNRELSAGQIAAHFDVTWPAVSQNLKVLREAGLVRERRDGNRRLYRAERKALRPLESVLRQMWEADLVRLRILSEDEERRTLREPRR